MSISDVITDPDSFFEREVKDPSMLAPTALVLLTALLAAVAASQKAHLVGEFSSMAIESQNASQINQSAKNFAAMGATVVTVGGAFVFFLLGWLLYSVVFFAISHLGYDGTGSFGDTVFLTGWGYLPAAISQAISAVAAYVVYSGATLPETYQAAERTMTELQSDPILLTAGVVSLVLLAWSGVIWTYAIAHLHDISRRNAAITVGVPVAIVMLMRINGLV